MDLHRFVLGVVLGRYIGFPRLNQLRLIARGPNLTGTLKVAKLPVQSTFRRFVIPLYLNVARQMLTIKRRMRERVWAAANAKLDVVSIDTDTTVHTLYGAQMGGCKPYNPKNKGKNSYQPMLTLIAETREYVWGNCATGTGPPANRSATIYGMCTPPCRREAVEAYEECNARFVISARRTSRSAEQLRQAEWKESKKTDVGWECEFRDPPEGRDNEYRVVALHYQNVGEDSEAEEAERYRLFETSQ